MLASSSPRRRDLLARLGLEPEIRRADVDEAPLDGEAPDVLVLRLARAKAAASARPRGDVIGIGGNDPGNAGEPGGAGERDAEAAAHDEVVLAADTIVALHGAALGKPRDADDAAAMLRRLSGHTHQVMTGIAVRHGERELTDLVTTDVTFRELTDGEVAWYLATGEPTDKAGAYALQGAGAVLVDRVDGSDTNVIGLPLAQTVVLLRACGLDLLTPPPS